MTGKDIPQLVIVIWWQNEAFQRAGKYPGGGSVDKG